MPPTVISALSPSSSFVPFLPPPPGVGSLPNRPPSLLKYSNLTTALCIPTITIFFLLRTYVRTVLREKWLYNKNRIIWEDVLTTIAWGGTVAFCIIMSATMAHNGGKHAWDITQAQAQEAAYWFNVAAIEYGVMICIVKLAVLLLYRRVFAPKCWSVFGISINVLVVILIGFYTATSLVKIFECVPRAKIVNPSIPGRCANLSSILKTSGAFNLVTDFIILFLPIHAVWKLPWKPSEKVLVVLVFTFGSWYAVLSI